MISPPHPARRMGQGGERKPGTRRPWHAATLVNGVKQLVGQITTLRERIEALEARALEAGV